MSYINAKEVLPKWLLDEVRSYAGEGLLYIPPTQPTRGAWGSKSGARQMLEDRNREIQAKKKEGMTVADLAQEYHLSTDTIKRILYR